MDEEIRTRIENRFPGAVIDVQVDGNRAVLGVTSEVFADMNRVQKQQAVYACVEDLIADGTLHAVTIRAEVPDG